MRSLSKIILKMTIPLLKCKDRSDYILIFTPTLDAVPDHNAIIRWIAAFRATGSTLKKNPLDRPKSIRIPENIESLRQSVQRSPRHSALKQAAISQFSGAKCVAAPGS